MNNTTTISQVQTGMVTDLNDLSLKGNQYTFALNAAIENETGSTPNVQNDSSNRLNANFPAGFKVIGRKYVPEAQRTIYALYNPTTNKSEFGEVRDCFFDDDKEDIDGATACCDELGNAYIENTPLEKTTQIPYCTYKTIVSADCFKFSMNNPVDIEYKVTNYGINIYFVDYKNPIRFLYFNFDSDLDLIVQDRFKVVTGYDPANCDLPIYSNAIDCNKIRYNPDFSRPCVEYVDLVSGGNIPAGTVQVLVAYADINKEPLTHYFPASEPIPIREKDITFDTNYKTDKALFMKINHLEQSNIFSYYNIVIAETVDNYTSFKLVATLPITQNSYTYTNNEADYVSLTANDIFFERPIYSTAASVTKANEHLFFARVKEAKKMNLQRVANRVKLFWQTKAISEKNLKNPRNVAQFRGYMRDEVYPLGLVFELTDDNDTIAFPIPGPSKAYFQATYGVDVDAVINNNDVLEDPTCVGAIRNKMWQVYNTARVIGTPHTQTENCEDEGCWEWGEFAYWESTERYPNIPEVWGELCGQPIRHHKFPDSKISHIHDGLNSTKGYNDTNTIFPIGIKVDETSILAALAWAVSQGIITPEERSRIKGYRIVRGNRVGHKSIVAKGLLYDMWKYNRDGEIYFPNFGYNDLRQNDYLSSDAELYKPGKDPAPLTFTKTGRYTFHSPDTHFSNPSLGTELKLETEEYGKSEGFFNLCKGQPKYKLLATGAYTLAYAFGVAAALSALKEKTCRTYVRKADYKNTQQDTTMNGSANGSAPYGNVTGSAPGAIITTPATAPWNGSSNATVKHGEAKTEHNNPYNNLPFKTFDVNSGSDNGVTGTSTSVNVESVTETTCKGSTYQVLNSNNSLGGLGGFLGGIFGGLTGETVNGIIYRTIIALREMQIMLDLFLTLVPGKNQAIQYNSVGKYNNYTPVDNTGNKIRKLDHATYLTSKNVIVNEATPVKINNWHRESSVYLKADGAKLLPNTSHIDNSRVTMDNVGYNYDQLNKMLYRDVCSYYAAIKDFRPDQYGTVYNIQFLETNGCSFVFGQTNNSCTTLFGGDTFLNRFALKRKHPFFIQTRFKMADDSDVLYSELGNAAFPSHFFNTKEAMFERLAEMDIGDIFSSFGGFASNVMNVPRTRLDAKVNHFFYQKGYTHLYHYGIPYFFVESDVNVDYRHGENNEEKDYYPHNRDIATWLQEEVVPISEDNYYIYNKSYSKQNKESDVKTIKPQYKFNDEKAVTHNNLLVYSDRGSMLKEGDNWLILRGNNFHKTDLAFGKIISVDGIEDTKVLIRSENGSQIFNAFDTIQSSAGTIQVSTGGMFQSRPQDFAVTDLGFMGSQHREIIHTEFGHVWADARRGQVFVLNLGGGGMDELTKNGMRNWFKQNLPFQVMKDFPNVTQEALDNNFKGLGLHFGFDKRFSRFFITKMDYKKKRNDIFFHNGEFYLPITSQSVILPPPDSTPAPVGELISLDDERYFTKKHWTISYNFLSKTWVSYHSFLPNYYVNMVDYFESGINGSQSSVWAHGITNKSFQVYYGKLYPFVIDTLTEPTMPMSYINSLEYMVDVIRYHNEYNWFYNRHITFNKAIVYNERQNSGELNLVVKDPEDFSTVGVYPRTLSNRTEVEVTNSQNLWSFNGFYDMVNCQLNNIPIWINEPSNADKKLNLKAFDFTKDEFDRARIRSKTNHVRYINDKWSNYKFIYFLTQFNQNRTFR
jgi:hypothetical protein